MKKARDIIEGMFGGDHSEGVPAPLPFAPARSRELLDWAKRRLGRETRPSNVDALHKVIDMLTRDLMAVSTGSAATPPARDIGSEASYMRGVQPSRPAYQ